MLITIECGAVKEVDWSQSLTCGALCSDFDCFGFEIHEGQVVSPPFYVVHFLLFPALKAIDYDVHPALEHREQNMETLKKGNVPKAFRNFDLSRKMFFVWSRAWD